MFGYPVAQLRQVAPENVFGRQVDEANYRHQPQSHADHAIIVLRERADRNDNAHRVCEFPTKRAEQPVARVHAGLIVT